LALDVHEQPPALEIRLFGSLELLESGKSLKFSGPLRAASLLAYLIVHRARPMSRDSLALTFWPDCEAAAARANLRRHAALIVRALPVCKSHKPITADYNSIRWNALYPCTIDIVRFERLSAEADGAAEASTIYRGDLLPDAVDEWVYPERERLRSMHCANLERLTERYTLSGDFAQAIASTRALLLHDPWREDAVRSLLSLRAASGDRAGALEEFERFAKRLRDDLDTDPMPETVRRFEAIRSSSGPVRSECASTLERSTIAARMPFVGRDDELTRLRQMWARTMRGTGGAAVVSGEAGIGKSRLVTEFGAIVAAQGGTVIAGSATYPEAMPYQAVTDALRSELPAILALHLDQTWLAAAADVLPELRDAAPQAPLSALEPERQQDRLFEAIWRCLEGLSRTRPLLLRFEDLHWAGAATLDLLAYLTRRVRNQRILVIMTCREDESGTSRPLRRLRQTLRRDGAFTPIALGGISGGETARILKALLPAVASAPGFAERAHELCCGNPFFLSEIVRDNLAVPAAAAQLSLPLSLATAIETRVTGLSPDAQVLAEVCSVVGAAFNVEIAASAAGIAEGTAVRCLDELLDVRLVRAAGAEWHRADDEFAFTHDIIRAQLYARIPDGRRRRLHRRVGFVLESLRANEIATFASELARHFDLGREAEKAAAMYLTSARQAIRQYADGDALRSLLRVMELTGEPDVRLDALFLREAIYGRAGRRAEQLADLEAIAVLAEQSTGEHRRLACLQRRIVFARAIDDVDAQQRWIDRLRTRIRVDRDRYWYAFCSESLAALMTSGGRYDDALTLAREAAAAYADASDNDGIVRSLCLIADISTWRGDLAASEAALEEATAIAVASSNEASLARALAASSLAAYMAVDFERAQSMAQRGLEICRAIGDRQGEADCLFRLGNIAGRRFAVSSAVEMYGAATTIYEALNKPLGSAIVLLNSGLLYLKTGEHTRALAALKSARAIFLLANDLRGLTICALNLGMAAYLRGRFGAALRLSQKAVALAQRLGNPQLECSALGNVGAAERELGESDAALRHCKMALDQRRRMAPLDIGSDLADMGLTYLRAGDVAGACVIAEEIEALPASALASVMFPQNVLWSAAQIYAAANQPEGYERALGRAFRLYEDRRANIPERSLQQTYARLAFNRAIVAAAARHSDDPRTPVAVHSKCDER
jgi:DNA-binding SARP family transcriptional activator/tetratricopeptide (TPR) repeat protein